LSERQAVLSDPDPAEFARGIEFALNDDDARTRARAAKEWAEKEYAPIRYAEKISQVLTLARRNHPG